MNLVSGNKVGNQIDTHFMSESGVFDLFVFMGPTLKDTVKQYTVITGSAPLPQVCFCVVLEIIPTFYI